MTTAELDALQPGTLLYIPTDTTVVSLLIDRRVGITDYYTFTQPPDEHGVVSNKRPTYLHALDLMNATLDEAEAYKAVLETIEENRVRINRKISSQP